jgi:hypothetical protein
MIIGGRTLNDPDVQAYLRWQRNRYNYQTHEAAMDGWTLSYYYFMWSSAKAYTFLEDSGVAPEAGNIDTRDLGMLPAGDAPALGPASCGSIPTPCRASAGAPSRRATMPISTSLRAGTLTTHIP